MKSDKNVTIDYCAGGLVWRETEAGREILLILSREDQAWKFPKGHIDDTDPGWDAAAQREVREETGHDTIITDFAGFTSYPVKGMPKVVLYWHMEPVGEHAFEESDEIVRFEWLPIRDAVDRLTFMNDKQFLLRFSNDDGSRNE